MEDAAGVPGLGGAGGGNGSVSQAEVRRNWPALLVNGGDEMLNPVRGERGGGVRPPWGVGDLACAVANARSVAAAVPSSVGARVALGQQRAGFP